MGTQHEEEGHSRIVGDKKKCIMEAMCRNIETIAENIKDYFESSDPESQREGHRNVRRLKNLLNSNIRGDC